MNKKESLILVPVADSERLRAEGCDLSRATLYKYSHLRKIPGLLIRPGGSRKLMFNVSLWREMCDQAIQKQKKEKKRLEDLV